MGEADFFGELAEQFKKRDNPKDLKSAIIARVEQVTPLVVLSYADGKIFLTEDDELIISEWFRFRCDIDKTQALSGTVVQDRVDSASSNNNAKSVSETHSASGAPCSMPNAISLLADSIDSLSDAILQINTEFLALKCRLKIGDNVVIASLEQEDRFILLDKVLQKEV